MTTLAELEAAMRTQGVQSAVIDLRTIKGKVIFRFKKRNGEWTEAALARETLEEAIADSPLKLPRSRGPRAASDDPLRELLG